MSLYDALLSGHMPRRANTRRRNLGAHILRGIPRHIVAASLRAVNLPPIPPTGYPLPNVGFANLYPYSATTTAAHFVCGCIATLRLRPCCGWRLHRIDWSCRAHTPPMRQGVMGQFVDTANMWVGCEVCS